MPPEKYGSGMGERPWYKHYPSNFIAGTMELSAEERGFYIVILDMMYDRDGYVADDAKAISRVQNSSVRKWETMRARLISLGKIEVDAGRLTNKRVLREVAKAKDSAKKLSENGRLGGQKQAENRVTMSRLKDLAQAGLKHTRSQIDKIDKKDHALSVDRQLYPRLFAACEAATGVPLSSQVLKHSFDMDVIGDAVKGLGGWC